MKKTNLRLEENTLKMFIIFKGLLKYNKKKSNPIFKSTKERNRHFFKEYVQMPNKDMKGITDSLLDLRNAAHTHYETLFYNHYVGYTKMTYNTKCWWELEKLELSYFAAVKVEWCSHSRAVRQFLRKLNIELSCDAAIPHLGVYTQRNEKMSSHKNLYTSILSSIIPKNSLVVITQMSINWRVDE